MKLQYNKKNEQYLLSIPNKLARGLGWEKGDNIDIQIGEKLTLILKKKIEGRYDTK